MSTGRGDRPVAPAPQRTVATPRTKTVGLSRYNRDYWYTHGCGLHMPQLGAPRNVQPLELCGSGSGVLEMSIKKCDTKASGIAFLVGVEMDPVESSLGALHIASGISAFFLGCLVLQAYRYFSDYPRDSRWIKSLIALMLLSELALHMTMTEVSYIMSIIHSGDPQVFSHISTSQLAPPLFLSVFAIPMNEIFYYWRIYRLLNWKWPSIIATVLSCCRTCGWIYYLSHATRLGLTALIADTSLRWLVILLFTFTIALNSCIVLVMTAYLSQHRKTPIMATRKLVERLIMWTVSTSMIAMYDLNLRLPSQALTNIKSRIPQMLSFILFVTMKESRTS
ncbi:hypothetical protein EYR40_009115 [Pleurotus pulmonarius]|nr:hypothetical protein EYR40_009115 [Pleurotus pulmonarius]